MELRPAAAPTAIAAAGATRMRCATADTIAATVAEHGLTRPADDDCNRTRLRGRDNAGQRVGRRARRRGHAPAHGLFLVEGNWGAVPGRDAAGWAAGARFDRPTAGVAAALAEAGVPD